MFKDKLKKVMIDLNLNQVKLSTLTGIGKSSISQYLSGKVEPTELRRREIAVALGLSPDYFNTDTSSVIEVSNTAIPRLIPEQVAKLTGMSSRTVRAGLRAGTFPWGYAVKNSNSDIWTYFINAIKFSEIEGIPLKGVDTSNAMYKEIKG